MFQTEKDTTWKSRRIGRKRSPWAAWRGWPERLNLAQGRHSHSSSSIAGTFRRQDLPRDGSAVGSRMWKKARRVREGGEGCVYARAGTNQAGRDAGGIAASPPLPLPSSLPLLLPPPHLFSSNDDESSSRTLTIKIKSLHTVIIF